MSEQSGAPLRVLAVLPDEHRGAVRGLLEDDGMRVEATGTATEGLSKLSATPFDGVVCGGELPDGDGLSFVRDVRASHEDLPVVALVDDARVGEAFEAGATDCVPPGTDSTRYERLPARLRSVVAWRSDAGEASRAAITEDLIQRAIDEAPVGITVSDPDLPDNPLVYVNDSYTEMTGYERSEALGRNCRFLQGAESDAETVRAMREAVDRRESASVELVNYRKDGTSFWNRVDIAPVHDVGGDGEVTHFVGFQTDITARKRAEAAAQRYADEASRERERLERLVDRVEGLLQDVTAILVTAETRDGLQRRICDRLVETDPYVAAWVGDGAVASDAIVSRVWAGDGADGLASMTVDAGSGGESDDPTARAAATRRLQLARGDGPGDLHPDAGGLPESFRAMAAIPLAHRETLYGVLNVYAEDADAIDDSEAAVLSLLGRAMGAAISAFESRRVLVGSEVVELEVRIADATVGFLALAAAADCRIVYEGSVSRDDGSVIVFATVDPDSDRVTGAVDAVDGVERAERITGHEGTGLYEFHCPGGTLVTRIAASGGRLRRLEADGESVELAVEVADRPTARALFATLRETYDGVELLATHERERTPSTREGFLDSLTEQLTERQRTALQTAYLGGFFEWPHAVTGDELAEAMGVSRSTFHQHLRAAQRKVLGAVYDPN